MTDSISVAKVTVELDVSTAGAMRKMLVDLVKQGRFFLVVDLTGVDHVDSTGVGVFIGVLKRIRAHDGALALVLTSDGVLRYFRWAGLTKVFPIFGTVDTAVEFLGREVPNAHA
ncbi:STAS domain-containing protein [Streptomyces sp. NBC_00287]|nr:STAS domain-containing protein [Streptomyces sp. NBC_00287]